MTWLGLKKLSEDCDSYWWDSLIPDQGEGWMTGQVCPTSPVPTSSGIWDTNLFLPGPQAGGYLAFQTNLSVHGSRVGFESAAIFAAISPCHFRKFSSCWACSRGGRAFHFLTRSPNSSARSENSRKVSLMLYLLLPKPVILLRELLQSFALSIRSARAFCQTIVWRFWFGSLMRQSSSRGRESASEDSPPAHELLQQLQLL